MVYRRLLYTEERVRAMFNRMRSELDEMAARHAAEAYRLRLELDEVRAQFDELRSTVLARTRAEVELDELRRLRDIGRARAAQRDSSTAVRWSFILGCDPSQVAISSKIEGHLNTQPKISTKPSSPRD
jgi:hypothetical protein